jgi:hypothetical protein
MMRNRRLGSLKSAEYIYINYVLKCLVSLFYFITRVTYVYEVLHCNRWWDGERWRGKGGGRDSQHRGLIMRDRSEVSV